MNGFLDTNVLVAKVFDINSLHFKARHIFKNYGELYYSNNCKMEFEKKFYNNLNYFFIFFEELLDDLLGLNVSEYSFNDLYSYINSQEFFKRDSNCYNILKNFWNIYIDATYVLLPVIIEAIKKFLKKFYYMSIYSYNEIINRVNLTPKRIKSYYNLENKLKKLGVHNSDCEIILDAYDFNLNFDEKLDFITFDQNFFKAIIRIKEFSFNEVKGLKNYY